MNTCVAWLLLFTHIVLLTLGGFGIFFAAYNFFISSSSIPTPPYSLPTPRSSIGGYDYDERPKAPADYVRYVRATEDYANYIYDPRLYLAIPCGVTLMVAGVLLMAGICSRKIFTTTVALYSSLGLWILTFLTAVMYQNVSWKSTPDFFAALPFVLGIQIAMIFLLFLQVILSIWELRRQNAGWPVINFTNLFTFGTILSVTQMTLAVYTATSLYYSPLVRGLSNRSIEYNFSDFWEYPSYKCPAYFVLPCAVICAYGLTVSFEGIASHFFGQVYNRLMVCTTLISAVCYGTLSVVASPVLIKATVGQYQVYPEVMTFASIMCALNFVQALTCMIFPSAMRTPPKFLCVIANHLSSTDLYSRDSYWNGITRDAIMSSFSAFSKGILALRKNFPWNNDLRFNILSLLVSFLALILVGTGVNQPWGEAWPSIVMLCGDTAVLCRTLPAIVTELVNHKLVPPPLLQITLHYALENCLLFIGAVGTFCFRMPCVIVAGAAVNLVYFIFQSILMAGNCLLLHKAATVKSEVTQEPEDTQPFAKIGPEDAQVLSDATQNGDPHSFA